MNRLELNMGSDKSKNAMSFNDRMVRRTVIPAIYLWLLSCAAVVGMGFAHPDVVLANLDGFIALIAIIGGTAAPALSTVLRMWESEQVQEVDNIPTELEHQRQINAEQEKHEIEMAKLEQEHQHKIESLEQAHRHAMCQKKK